MKKIISVSLFCLVGFLLFFGNSIYKTLIRESETQYDQGKLEKILFNKELRVVLDLNTINYFIYKGEPRGFQYELLREFCAENMLKLTIIPSNDIDQSIEELKSDKVDLVAKNFITDSQPSIPVDFTKPLHKSKIVLVQRKSSRVGFLKELNKTEYIESRSDLMGKVVHVSTNSSFPNQISEINHDLGNSIQVINDSLLSTEQLIDLVASGKIDFTVCKDATGLFLKQHYPNLDFSTPLAFDQEYSWMIKSGNPVWKEFLNKWIVNFKQTERYNEIVEQYYSERLTKFFDEKEYTSFLGGKLSEYDELIRDIAGKYHFDWRLISSIVYKESKFDNNAESRKGAYGLMQLMPLTAEFFNVFDMKNPRDNIRGGVAYLSWLNDLFLPIVTNDEERLKFVLAAYNVGIGHVMDARRLAMKYDQDPSVWDGSVDYFLLRKSDPLFYNDPIVEHGYCRGVEPLNFVEKVLDRYSHYVNIIPSNEKKTLAAL